MIAASETLYSDSDTTGNATEGHPGVSGTAAGSTGIDAVLDRLVSGHLGQRIVEAARMAATRAMLLETEADAFELEAESSRRCL